MKYAIPVKTVKLLRRVEAHILEEPRRYDQNNIICKLKPGTEYRAGHTVPPCGTVACIGGWIQLLTKKRPHHHDLPLESMARQLGVSATAMGALCAYTYEGLWPAQYIAAYERAKTPRARARVAVRRIEHFIKTAR